MSEMNDANIKRICKACTKLEEIDVSDDVLITDLSMEYFNTLPELRVLTISRCYAIEPVKLLTLRNLDVLNCYGCVTGNGYDVLKSRLSPTRINTSPFSSIARPTVGESISSIWGQRTRDWY